MKRKDRYKILDQSLDQEAEKLFFDHEYMANQFATLSNPNLYICLINPKYRYLIVQFKESYDSLRDTTNNCPTHLFNVELHWTDKISTWAIISKNCLN